MKSEKGQEAVLTYSCGCTFSDVVKFSGGNSRICPSCGTRQIKIEKIERDCLDCGTRLSFVRLKHQTRISSEKKRCEECSYKYLRRQQLASRKTKQPYRRRIIKKKSIVPQPLCTCCGETPKDPDLRFLCRRCYSDNSELSDAAYYDRNHRVVEEKMGLYS